MARGSVEEFYVAMTETLRAAIEFRIILAPDPLGVPPKPRIRQHHGASRHLRTAVAINRMASTKSARSLSRKHEIAPRYACAAIGSPVLSARARSPLDDLENASLLNPATAELFHHQTGDDAVERALVSLGAGPGDAVRIPRGGGCGVPFCLTRTATTQSMR